MNGTNGTLVRSYAVAIDVLRTERAPTPKRETGELASTATPARLRREGNR